MSKRSTVGRGTKTSAFGMSKRESHDSSAFYERNLYSGDPDDNGSRLVLDESRTWLGPQRVAQDNDGSLRTRDDGAPREAPRRQNAPAPVEVSGGKEANAPVEASGGKEANASFEAAGHEQANASVEAAGHEQANASVEASGGKETNASVERSHQKQAETECAPATRTSTRDRSASASGIPTDDSAPPWANQVYCHSSEDMVHIPDDSVGLAFTSPPYNVGKDYDDDTSLTEYLDLISRVGREVYRVLQPGGRYVVNIANLGRKPYIPLHAYFYARHIDIGFLPAGEIIWQKGRGMSGSCAWGSWMSAKAPRLRDIHEYLLVFVKQDFSRPDRGISDIGRDEFMSSTLSIWEVPPESARKVGHPAPFPVALAERVIRLYSYVDDVVLDPFNGSGSTCVAALRNNRRWVGYDIEPQYCALAEKRLQEAAAARTNPSD